MRGKGVQPGAPWPPGQGWGEPNRGYRAANALPSQSVGTSTGRCAACQRPQGRDPVWGATPRTPAKRGQGGAAAVREANGPPCPRFSGVPRGRRPLERSERQGSALFLASSQKRGWEAAPAATQRVPDPLEMSCAGRSPESTCVRFTIAISPYQCEK